MAIPNVKVEIAFNAGYSTPAASRTWTDVSDYVEGDSEVAITYGRADELAAADPSRMSVTLDNRDGRFSPGRAASPYFPNVKKGKPVRVSVTYAGTRYDRFLGYIDEWPLVWPDGSHAASTVTISATSRRARLGQGVPLSSAIRAAYLATNPIRYWPIDEDGDVVAINDQPIYRNIAPPFFNDKVLGAYARPGYQLLRNDGLPGPTDEAGLLKFPSYSNTALIGAGVHYVSAGRVIAVANNLTAECVARVSAQEDLYSLGELMRLQTSDSNSAMLFSVNSIGFPEFNGVYGEMMYRDPDTGAVLSDVTGYNAPGTPAAFLSAIDGNIHHFAMTLTGGNVGRFYMDGALIHTLTLGSPYLFSRNFTSVIVGNESLNTDLWIGHVAIHDRALTASEIATRAAAATAASESVEARVKRLAGYAGIPAGEVIVEPTIAAPLGAQAESGRAPSEVIDEVAASTGGIVYDDRTGNLVMQARNHRYNAPVALSLSATLQEVQGDLEAVLDDRYLTNMIEASREGDSDTTGIILDQASIDAYGIYSRTIAAVSTELTEIEGAARNALTRYAEPVVRVSQVGVDVGNISGSDGPFYGDGLYGAGVYPGATQQSLILAADIGTQFTITGLPAQAPFDPWPLFLEGYTESITATSHMLTLNTTPADRVQKWVLGSPTLSVLASTTIPAY